MYTATFTYAKKQFDTQFHELDAKISTYAQSIDGYLGEERWENPQTGLFSTVYYWQTLEALQLLTQHPDHLLAKKAQSNWLDGYQITISQILKMYGDKQWSPTHSIISGTP